MYTGTVITVFLSRVNVEMKTLPVNEKLCLLSVKVNTADATTGATALLLPAQNTNTLQLPPVSLYR